jgi:hypothetical protein
MKTAVWVASALIVSSFSPVALPNLVGTATAQTSTNVLLCTNSRLLGGSQSGQFWGTPFLLPFNVTMTTTFTGPFGSGDTEHYIGTRTIRNAPLIQRCPVMNAAGRSTGKHQDVQLSGPSTLTDEFRCQPQVTTAGLNLGYVYCNFPDGAGSSGDDR